MKAGIVTWEDAMGWRGTATLTDEDGVEVHARGFGTAGHDSRRAAYEAVAARVLAKWEVEAPEYEEEP